MSALARVLGVLGGLLLDIADLLSGLKVKPEVVAWSEIEKLFKRLPGYDASRVLVLDRVYWVLREADFRRIVERDWTNSRLYRAEKFDCDDYALAFKERLAWRYGVNSVAVILDWSGGHAYNAVPLIRDEARLDLVLFEPQRDEIIELSDPRVGSGQYKLANWHAII